MIVPWTSPEAVELTQLFQWRKNIKPSFNDYKEFRNENFWQIWKQKTVNTIQAHSLGHHIQTDYKVMDKEFDTAQQQWEL